MTEHPAKPRTAKPPGWRRALRIVGINLAVLLAGLAVLELVFGTWFSDTHALHQFTKPRDLRMVRDNPLGDDPPKIVYSRDDNGLRGLDAGVGEIDILTVGGSTTDQRLLDDGQTFQARLKALFAEQGRAVVIANAGIDGQSTYGHIENFASWFRRIDGLKPRFILFYVGINDVLILDDDAAYDRVEAMSPRLRAQLFVREKSALYQMYLLARNALAAPEMQHVENRANIVGDGELASAPALTPEALETPEIAASLAALSQRVERLAELTREMGATPIFVTQRSAAWTRRDGVVVGVPRLGPGFHNRLVAQFGDINGVDIHRIERKTADAILAGCRASRAICLDLMADVDFDPQADFYDSLHTTASGAEAIARYLHGRLSGLDGF